MPNKSLVPKLKKTFIFLVIFMIVLLVGSIYIKEFLVSIKLSKIFSAPVTVHNINFDLEKIYSLRSVKIGALEIGKGDTKFFLRDIFIHDIKPNLNSSYKCVDGIMEVENIFVKKDLGSNCDATLKFNCIALGKTPEFFTINIPDLKVNVNQKAAANSSLDINVHKKKSAELNFHGTLNSADLKSVMKCLGNEVDSNYQAKVPHFDIRLFFHDKTYELSGRGNFILTGDREKIYAEIKKFIDGIKNIDFRNKGKREENRVEGIFDLDKEKATLSKVSFDSEYFNAYGEGDMFYNNNVDMFFSVNLIENFMPFKIKVMNQILPSGQLPIKVEGTQLKPKIRFSISNMQKTYTPPIFETLGKGTKKFLIDPLRTIKVFNY